MKQTLLILFTVISVISFGQGTSSNKADSIFQIEAKKFIDSLPAKSTLKEFQDFLYQTTTAKEYDEKFSPLYQLFLQTKYNAWLSEKKKKN
jgi:hypothetical protein